MSLNELKCVNETAVDTRICLKPCSGLIISTFSKYAKNKNWDQLENLFKDYDKYKKHTSVPSDSKGKYIIYKNGYCCGEQLYVSKCCLSAVLLLSN